MASIYDLKPNFQTLLRPRVEKLAAHGTTANQVTLTACIASVIVGLILIIYPHRILFFLLPVMLFARMALNAIDGMLAREHNQQSSLGAILNEVCDIISDIALYLPFALLTSLSSILVPLIIIMAVISEYVGVLGAVVGKTRRYEGPMGKSDRAFAFGVLGLAVGFAIPAQWFHGALLVMLILLALTIRNRARKTLAESAQ